MLLADDLGLDRQEPIGFAHQPGPCLGLGIGAARELLGGEDLGGVRDPLSLCRNLDGRRQPCLVVLYVQDQLRPSFGAILAGVRVDQAAYTTPPPRASR